MHKDLFALWTDAMEKSVWSHTLGYEYWCEWESKLLWESHFYHLRNIVWIPRREKTCMQFHTFLNFKYETAVIKKLIYSLFPCCASCSISVFLFLNCWFSAVKVDNIMGMCSISFKPLQICHLACFSFCLEFSPCLLLKPCENNVSSEGPQNKQSLGQTCWNLRWEGVLLQAPWPQPSKGKTCLEQHTPAMGGEELCRLRMHKFEADGKGRIE